MARAGIFPLIFFVDERFVLKGKLPNFFFLLAHSMYILFIVVICMYISFIKSISLQPNEAQTA